MPMYRLKHKPTGLYFVPVRLVNNPNFDGTLGSRRKVKSNLSEEGKVYHRWPSVRARMPTYYNHLEVEGQDKLRLIREEDWEVEEL